MRHCMALRLTSEDAKGEKEELEEGRPFPPAVICLVIHRQTTLLTFAPFLDKRGHNVREAGYSTQTHIVQLRLFGVKPVAEIKVQVATVSMTHKQKRETVYVGGWWCKL